MVAHENVLWNSPSSAQWRMAGGLHLPLMWLPNTDLLCLWGFDSGHLCRLHLRASDIGFPCSVLENTVQFLARPLPLLWKGETLPQLIIFRGHHPYGSASSILGGTQICGCGKRAGKSNQGGEVEVSANLACCRKGAFRAIRNEATDSLHSDRTPFHGEILSGRPSWRTCPWPSILDPLTAVWLRLATGSHICTKWHLSAVAWPFISGWCSWLP